MTRFQTHWKKSVLALLCLFAVCGAPAQVSPGIDVLAAQGFAPLKGKRVGLITNQTGRNRAGRSSIDVLRQAPGVKLVALFAPEHGIDGTIKAGDHVPFRKHRGTGLPVYSLYGDTRKPRSQWLANLDVLVFDLQDIGCRSYTYLSTMGLAMQACAAAGKEFVVLDRPNPLGGVRVEGPPLNPSWRSFVGQFDVPYVHGLTAGEMAKWVNRSSWMGKPCRLTVVPMRGWSRRMLWADTGLRWVPTSPNIPRAESALHYVVTGGLGASKAGFDLALGTPSSFGYACAGWLDASRYATAMNRVGIEGIRFEPAQRGGSEGVRIVYTDPLNADLCAAAAYLMTVAQKQKGAPLFNKKASVYEIFDKCAGGPALRTSVARGASARDIIASWNPSVERFRSARTAVLLYP